MLKSSWNADTFRHHYDRMFHTVPYSKTDGDFEQL